MIVLFNIALITVIVSTSDSVVNTGSIILVHDVVGDKITKEKPKLILLRLVTIVLGISASLFAYLFPGILDIVLFITEYYMVIVLAPFVGGLFAKEIRQEAFWSSSVFGFVTFSVLHFLYPDVSHEMFLVSFLSTICIYFSTMILFKEKNIQNLQGAFYKTCDLIVSRLSSQLNNISWLIVIFFLLSALISSDYDRDIYDFMFEGFIGGLGTFLFFTEELSTKYKGTIVLSVVWFCISFFPVYIFLNQTLYSLFTIKFIISSL